MMHYQYIQQLLNKQKYSSQYLFVSVDWMVVIKVKSAFEILQCISDCCPYVPNQINNIRGLAATNKEIFFYYSDSIKLFAEWDDVYFL